MYIRPLLVTRSNFQQSSESIKWLQIHQSIRNSDKKILLACRYLHSQQPRILHWTPRHLCRYIIQPKSLCSSCTPYVSFFRWKGTTLFRGGVELLGGAQGPSCTRLWRGSRRRRGSWPPSLEASLGLGRRQWGRTEGSADDGGGDARGWGGVGSFF